MELFNIEGKKAIVTGGTRGLGYGMAEGLMEAGCEVVIVGTSDKVQKVAESFVNRGFHCHGVKADFAKREGVYEGFAACVEKLGGDLETVKRSISLAAGQCHVEVTTLLVPGENDSEEEIRNLAQWLASVDGISPCTCPSFFLVIR